MNAPEKLNLWDRIFNRYKTIVVEEGSETWHKYVSGAGIKIPDSEFKRTFVKYKKIDRLTGSEKIYRIFI